MAKQSIILKSIRFYTNVCIQSLNKQYFYYIWGFLFFLLFFWRSERSFSFVFCDQRGLSLSLSFSFLFFRRSEEVKFAILQANERRTQPQCCGDYLTHQFLFFLHGFLSIFSDSRTKFA